MKNLRSPRGSALLAAMGAVFVSGMVGVSIVASYESFLRNSRLTYVRSIMSTVDNKIRFLAMQPYAYVCNDQASFQGGTASCVINRAYFKDVSNIVIPGACAPPTECGLKLRFRGDPPTGNPTNNPALNSRLTTNPNTGESETQGLFAYELKYEGTELGKDVQLRPGGYDLTKTDVGLPIPREILQSGTYDCAEVDPTHPVFGGYDQAGKPICRGFQNCPKGTYCSGVTFRTLASGTPDLATYPKPLDTPDKQVDCRPPYAAAQNMIDAITFNKGKISHVCRILPIPDINYVPPTPINGRCGEAAGSKPATIPTTNLCAIGDATAVAGTNPWTWSCLGQYGGSDASCDSNKKPGNLVFLLTMDSTQKKVGAYDLFVDSTGALCQNGHIFFSDTRGTYVAGGTPRQNAPGNGPECPNMGGEAATSPIPSNVPCTNEGQKCMFTLTQQGKDYPFAGPIGVHTHVSNCMYLKCTDTAKCPDGSYKDGSGLCPSFSGVWNSGENLGPTTTGLPSCPEANLSYPCSPYGKRCAYPYAIPSGTFILFECR